MLTFALLLFANIAGPSLEGAIDFGCDTQKVTLPTTSWRRSVATVRYKDKPDFKQTIFTIEEPPGTSVKQQKKNIEQGSKACAIWVADRLGQSAKGSK